ncbi:hypothetical protein ABZX38_17710 [Streptomyces longwoodensis]|uniref:hypothetical protein n=1 Tax=Streptomyces longwoodensis TaxID=68231 RepID=UPI0033BA2A22
MDQEKGTPMADRTVVHRWDQRFATWGNEEERSRRLAQLHAQGIYPALFAPEVLVTALLAPFVAAVATSLGTSLGGSIEKALRTVLRKAPRQSVLGRRRRLLGWRERRHQGHEPDRSAGAGDTPATVTLAHEAGAMIQITTWTPTGALTLLPTVDFSGLAALGDVPAIVRWMDDGWHAFSLKESRIVEVAWDEDAAQWAPYRGPLAGSPD